MASINKGYFILMDGDDHNRPAVGGRAGLYIGDKDCIVGRREFPRRPLTTVYDARGEYSDHR